MSILTAIGNTPLIEITGLNHRKPDVKIFGKLEGANPGGSVKDRPALSMIQTAVRSDLLKRGQTIIEATSGNMGIALVTIGAAMGYDVTLCMPECVSVERKKILEALGGHVILTPASQGTDGAIARAEEIALGDKEKYYHPNQFDNVWNWKAHYCTTGPEILKQTDGCITHFVAGMGTTGTLMGVSKFIKEIRPDVKICGVEPLIGHKIQGLKNMTESIKPGIYDPGLLDEVIPVSDDEAFEATRQLALKEGLFVGMSSGAAIVGALKIAKSIESGCVVAVFPDRGDRYLSTNLFKSICSKCPP
jgi:cysteine synthase B